MSSAKRPPANGTFNNSAASGIPRTSYSTSAKSCGGVVGHHIPTHDYLYERGYWIKLWRHAIQKDRFKQLINKKAVYYGIFNLKETTKEGNQT